MDKIKELTTQLRQFAKERNWEQFHSPKNLSMALAGEAGELLEVFQWMTEQDSQALSDKKLASAKEEIADVLLYLIRLADQLNIDLLEVAQEKLNTNARKYPIDLSYGSSKKYTELGRQNDCLLKDQK